MNRSRNEVIPKTKGGSSLSYASCDMTTWGLGVRTRTRLRQDMPPRPSKTKADRGMYTDTYPARYTLSEKCLMETYPLHLEVES
jgi:hypothetical protein